MRVGESTSLLVANDEGPGEGEASEIGTDVMLPVADVKSVGSDDGDARGSSESDSAGVDDGLPDGSFSV